MTFFMAIIALLLSGCTTYIFGLSQTTSYDTLILKFETDRSKVRVGEPVPIRFTIKNVGNKPYMVESQNTPVMDIRVDGDGTHLDWSEQNPNQIAHHLEWQPDESKVIEWTWIPRQEDVYIGAYHDIALIGILFGGHAASVRVCASYICR